MANEKRLIDANPLVENLQADFKKVFHNAGQKVKPEDYYITRKSVYDADLFKAEVDGFCDLIDCQPTVDAVEVVRCKDCVKRETVLCPLETYDDFPWRASREDDFCSYGERRTE